MVKPILTIGLPSGTSLEQLQATSKELNNPNKQIGQEYHILCYVQAKGEEIKFEVFYEKDFTEIQYEELKALILKEIKGVDVIESKSDDNESMNIHAKGGDKVICSNLDNGYSTDQELAQIWLKIGNVYTVERTEVNGWSTTVLLQEFPDIQFNSVFFKDYKGE